MSTIQSTPVSWGNQYTDSITDAQFQARCLATHNALLAAGVVAVDNQNNTDLSTILAPTAPSQDRGYVIYRFNDSRQGTDPIYFKLTFGSGVTYNARHRTKIQVGQGATNGVLTGQVSGQISMGDATSTNSTGSQVTMYVCHTEGFLGMFGIADIVFVQPAVSFTIARSKDESLTFNGLGTVCWFGETSGSGRTYFLRTADNPKVYGGSFSYCIAPGVPSNTALTNGDKQLYPHFYNDPSIRQMWHQCTVRYNEISSLPTTFTAAPIGGVTRTFLIGGQRGDSGMSDNNSAFNIAMLWED